MSAASDDDRFAQVARRVNPGAKLQRHWDLAGGVSARVTALEIQEPAGETVRLVVRRYGETDLRHKPTVAANEHRLLCLVRSHGIPAPEPHFFDNSGTIFPTPYLVVEYVEGQPELAAGRDADLVPALAAQLAAIHRIDAASADLSFLRRAGDVVAGVLRQPARDADEAAIRVILGTVWPLEPRNPTVLLHGDYWPGNALWRDGRLAAIIDWEDAAIGDPLADLANARLEILWAFGPAAMRQFTARYLALAHVNLVHLPYWDLWAALRPMDRFEEWAEDAGARATMRQRHGWFVGQALAALRDYG